MSTLPLTPSPAPAVFLPYQVARLLDDSPFLLDEKARRIGLTYLYAFKYTIKRAVLGGKTWYTANDAGTVREFMEYVARFARLVNDHLRIERAPFAIDHREVLSRMLRFSSGGQVIGLSSNPLALHGKGGDFIGDEFAYHSRASTMWEAAQAMTMWGGDLVILSTHTGIHSQFNQLTIQARKLRGLACEPGAAAAAAAGDPIPDLAHSAGVLPWSYRRTTIHDALAEGLAEKISARTGRPLSREAFLAECRARCLTAEQWQRQYECVPGGEANIFLPFKLLLPNVADDCLKSLGACENLYLGVDFGRHGHHTSIITGELVGDVLWVREVLRLHGELWSFQLKRIGAVMGLPRFVRACCDSTGLGDMPVEELQGRFGAGRVTGLKFTLAAKANLALPLRRRFEDRSIRIPNDHALLDSLNKVRAGTSIDGAAVFEADARNGDHADDFWALALLAAAAAPRQAPFGYTAVSETYNETSRFSTGRRGMPL